MLHVDSPDQIKNKTETNPTNKKDNKCFQYVMTVALNHKQIKNHSERITKITPFVDKYDKYKYEGIIYPSEKVDWKNIEKNNLTIALNVAYAEKEKVYQNREKKKGKTNYFFRTDKDGIILQ